MADGSFFERNYRVESKNFGKLDKASSEVWIQFEPKNQETYNAIKEVLSSLGLVPDRPTTEKKMIRCFSDVIMATKSSTNGLICWPSGNDHFTGAAYGGEIARRVKAVLARNEIIIKHQKSSKLDKLAEIYIGIEESWMRNLCFKPHGIGPTVEVRSEKFRQGNRISGGKKMSRGRFLPKIADLEAEVKEINVMMLKHPLTDLGGTNFGLCKRIFNQGSLQLGGRLYGRWQSLKEEDRLNLLINGDAVCEIDVRAMFLSIAKAKFDTCKFPFCQDPYKLIQFVQKSVGPDRQATMRKLAKLLVSAYLSNGKRTDRFPKGEKIGTGSHARIVSVKEKYNLPKHARAEDYYGDILSTFPFLNGISVNSYDLMFIESEIMVHALIDLNRSDIVAYPVHDCLMCRQTEEDFVVKAMQRAMLAKLGSIILMEVSYPNRPTKLVNPLTAEEPVSPESAHKQSLLLDDFEVLEDFDLGE